MGLSLTSLLSSFLLFSALSCDFTHPFLCPLLPSFAPSSLLFALFYLQRFFPVRFLFSFRFRCLKLLPRSTFRYRARVSGSAGWAFIVSRVLGFSLAFYLLLYLSPPPPAAAARAVSLRFLALCFGLFTPAGEALVPCPFPAARRALSLTVVRRGGAPLAPVCASPLRLRRPTPIHPLLHGRPLCLLLRRCLPRHFPAARIHLL